MNLEIEEDFVRRPNGLRRRSKRTTPTTSSLSPVQPAYLPQPQLPSQPPAIQPLGLTSRVGAINLGQLVNLLQIYENEVIKSVDQ